MKTEKLLHVKGVTCSYPTNTSGSIYSKKTNRHKKQNKNHEKSTNVWVQRTNLQSPPSKEFTVWSGETPAGKLGAVGSRSSPELIRWESCSSLETSLAWGLGLLKKSGFWQVGHSNYNLTLDPTWGSHTILAFNYVIQAPVRNSQAKSMILQIWGLTKISSMQRASWLWPLVPIIYELYLIMS